MPFDPNRIKKLTVPAAPEPDVQVILPNASAPDTDMNEIQVDKDSIPVRAEQPKGGFNPDRVKQVEQAVDADPTLLEKFRAGFMGRPVQNGGMAEAAGKYGLEFAGGVAGSFASPVVGTGVGAGIGSAAHSIGKKLAGAEVSPVAAGADALIETGTNMLGGAAGKYVLGPVAKFGIAKTGDTAAWVGKNLMVPPMRAIAGVSREAMEQIIDQPGKVMKFIGEAPGALQGYAEAFVESISTNATKADNAYWKLINGTIHTNKKYGQFKVDLMNGELSKNISPGLKRLLKTAGATTDPTISDITAGVYKTFGFGRMGRINDAVETKLFNEFATALPKLENATLEEVYYFQKDLTKAIAKNTDVYGNKAPVAVALSYLKEGVMDHLADRVPEISKANKLYARSMDLTDRLSKVLRADNPARVMMAAIKGKTNTGKALIDAANRAANSRKALEGVKFGEAAQEFSPWIKSPLTSPRAIGYGAAAVSGAKTMAVDTANSKPVAAVGKAALTGVSVVAADSASAAYKTPGDVKSAYKQGKLTEDQAFSILSKNFPRYFK